MKRSVWTICLSILLVLAIASCQKSETGSAPESLDPLPTPISQEKQAEPQESISSLTRDEILDAISDGSSDAEKTSSEQQALPTSLSGEVVISYADAAERLTSIPAEDHLDQIADWAVWGLAGILDMDVTTLRSVFYDRPAIRDPLFTDVATYHTGPGRGLPDGSGNLYVLVPEEDPYESRSIGNVLDDYRKDAGVDPATVFLSHYKIDTNRESITLESFMPLSLEEIRRDHGYVEMVLAEPDDLAAFLTATSHLSFLEIRNMTLWAGGWSWPEVPTGEVSIGDIAVLQRGYLRALEGEAREPAFSLDEGEPFPIDEFVGLLDPSDFPQLETKANLIDFLMSLNKLGEDGASEVLLSDFVATDVLGQERFDSLTNAIFEAETEEEQADAVDEYLRALLSAIKDLVSGDDLLKLIYNAEGGRSPYQKARYEGGLQGTEAGMTYFYTDLLAKAWLSGIGLETPYGKVDGFVSDLNAEIPLGQCSNEVEDGRIWFGLRDEALSLSETRISFGSTTTRLFTLINDPIVGDREVEPSYSFGRGVWWWDQHYQEMADFEPQYHRLDQLMRWGAAIAWLISFDEVGLPELEAEVPADLKFDEWYPEQVDLKWNYDIPFVNASLGEPTETLLTLYSELYESCNSTWQISGGVSNPSIRDILRRVVDAPVLPSAVGRGGLSAGATDFVADAGIIGKLDNKVRYVFPDVSEGLLASVEAIADGRKVWSTGATRILQGDSVPREFTFDFSSNAGTASQRISVYGSELGEFNVNATSTSASVSWQPGVFDRIGRVSTSIQDALTRPGASVASVLADITDGPVFKEPRSNSFWFALDESGMGNWVLFEEGSSVQVDGLLLGVGVADELNGGVKFYSAGLAEALIESQTELAKLRAVQRAAELSGDGYSRVSRYNAEPEGLALANKDYISLVPSTDPWHRKLSAALEDTPATIPPLIKEDGSNIMLVQDISRVVDATDLSSGYVGNLDDIIDSLFDPGVDAPPTYFEAALADQILEEGRLLPGVHSNQRIRVKEHFVEEPVNGDAVLLTDGEEYRRAYAEDTSEGSWPGITFIRLVSLEYACDGSEEDEDCQ